MENVEKKGGVLVDLKVRVSDGVVVKIVVGDRVSIASTVRIVVMAKRKVAIFVAGRVVMVMLPGWRTSRTRPRAWIWAWPSSRSRSRTWKWAWSRSRTVSWSGSEWWSWSGPVSRSRTRAGSW